MPLGELIGFVKKIPSQMPCDMRPMAESIASEFLAISERLIDLGLNYLTLDRSANTHFHPANCNAFSLRVPSEIKPPEFMYVLDEPSIGLHPQTWTACLPSFAIL